jgi:hypothetical protein
VLSALGLGGTPDPNPKPIDSETAQKIASDVINKNPAQNPVDVLGVPEVAGLISDTYQAVTGVTNGARDFWANEFAKGNGLAIVPGLVATSLDSDHLPGTVLTVATVGGSGAVAGTNAGKAVLTSPVVQSAFALDTGLNIGQTITGTDLQGNQLTETERLVKGASGVLGVLGLPGTATTPKNTSGIADDAANLGNKTGDPVQPTNNVETTGNPNGATSDTNGVRVSPLDNRNNFDELPRITNKVSDADSGLQNPKILEGIEIRDGKIYNQSGTLHNPNRGVDFVVGSDGNLYLGNKHQYLAKFGGDKNEVIAAGTMKVKNGKVTVVENSSGHFLPTKAETLNYPQILREFGIDLTGSQLFIYGKSGGIIQHVPLK